MDRFDSYYLDLRDNNRDNNREVTMSCNKPNCCKKTTPVVSNDATSVTQPPTGVAEATANAVDASKKENTDG